MTNSQQQIIDSLIYEFGRMNESKNNDTDLLSYINNQVDEQSILRKEAREKSNGFSYINHQILEGLVEQIKLLTDHFGYEYTMFGGEKVSDYIGISIKWNGHEGLYRNYQSYHLSPKWNWFGDTSINSFAVLTEYGYIYSRGTKGCSDYVEFATEKDFLKDIANQIIEIRKRDL